ncbi:MAG: cytidine deaminase [Planctomycetes bacterium]|nr:cytidine deaminase [Planctomycetota bacterium]
MPLSPRDRALVAAAEALIRARFSPERQHLAAAVRTAGGRVHAGVNLDTYVGRCATCAEAVALGAAVAAGDRAIDTVVAVRWVGRGRARVANPCGVCREMLVSYGDPWVVHERAGRLVRSRASALLPDRYRRHGEPDVRRRSSR